VVTFIALADLPLATVSGTVPTVQTLGALEKRNYLLLLLGIKPRF